MTPGSCTRLRGRYYRTHFPTRGVNSRAQWRLNKRKDARDHLNEAVSFAIQMNSWHMHAHCNLLLGTWAREEGDYTKAKSHYNAVWHLMVDDGNMPTHATTAAILYKLGCVACDEKEYDEALSVII
ncbi:hypothetical protein K505DRAFT_332564 [Melanomma pulvis-pyrius CBS 109.77]|uniref:TPR-like protein n=1 Tax=Melanomma pulvis-pyrius CBS 109.77 TaxID=1314802 RepID=A0A6A6XS66_9PLEO|nr:hypothetical protein K505DRAFT_332564 [Melanomma pulvis-pyrius CBS 109.77]